MNDYQWGALLYMFQDIAVEGVILSIVVAGGIQFALGGSAWATKKVGRFFK